MSRKATVSVNWKTYGLSASLDVEAPDLRTSFSISIDGLKEDTLDGGYPYIPSSDINALYRIILTDNLGTTDEQWYEKYNAGQLTFTKESSIISIVVSDGLFYMKMTSLGDTTINSRYIRATINDESGSSMTAETYYRHPPFGATITIRDFEVLHNSSAVTLADSGVFFNVEMRISGTNGSYISEDEFFNLVYNGIYYLIFNSSASSVSSNSVSLDTSSRRISIFIDASSTARTISYYIHTAWNGDSYTVTEIGMRNWYPKNSYTTFCLVMLFSTTTQMSAGTTFSYEPGSNMYIDITSTWVAGSDSDESQANTYGKHVYAEDIKKLYDSAPSKFFSGYYPYLSLGIHDSRISAQHLYEYLDRSYISNTAYSRELNCACYIRSYRYTNVNGDHFLFTPAIYNNSSSGFYDSGTAYINDDENGIQIVTIGTQFRYIYSDTPSCGYSYKIAHNMPLYDYISLSFYHRAEVESGTGYTFHTSYYLYLDFRDNEGDDYSNIYWRSSYVYGVSNDVPAGYPYQIITYQINNDT